MIEIKNSQLNRENNEQTVPEPPPLEIEIRTMASDLRALKEGGGELTGGGARAIFIREKKEDDSAQNILKNVPGYLGPEQTIFPSTENETGAATEEKNISQDISQNNYWNLIIWAIIIIGFITSLILLGYYVVFPMIFR